jgi:hypothetical protein
MGAGLVLSFTIRDNTKSPFLMNSAKSVLILALLVTVALPGIPAETDVAVDPAKAPDAATALALLQEGPQTASEKIWTALGEAYEPGRGMSGGSSRNTAFRSWLRLGVWFSLLAQTDEAEFARFLEPYLAFGNKDGERVIFWRPPDTSFSSGEESLPLEKRAAIAADARARETYLERFIPGHFQWLNSPLSDYLGPELARELTGDAQRLEEILQTLAPGDFLPAVFQNLRQLNEHSPENFDRYFNLALALAVVFDQKPPPDWPHHQVSQSSLPPDEQTIAQRFDFWVESHAKRKLTADPTRLGADQLKFVVDALVPAEELEFAQNRLRFTRSAFDRAYSSIKYDQGRIKRDQFAWPDDQPYTLEEIQKRGGICVDQAFFAMIAGKAKGIPTLYFTGQGAAGGHAWFGFLQSDTRWNLDAGRYENQNFAVGAALDPQVWERITDHELNFLGQRVRRTPAFQGGQADLLMARYFLDKGQPDRAMEAAASALAGSPQNPEAWDLQFELLRQSNAPFAKIQEHLEKAGKNFHNEADLRTHYQTLLASAAREAGEEKLAADLESRVIRQNMSRRSDLSVGAASGQINSLLAEGKVDEALREFRSQVNRLGRTGGGNFFYEVVAPIVEHLLAGDNPREAKRVLDQARRGLRPERGSILDNELASLEARCDPRRGG